MSGGDDVQKPGKKLPHSHRGRSGSEKRQRTSFVGFRATQAELDKIDEKVERTGLTRSAFARASMIDAPEMPATRRPPVERATLAAILAQLGKCGSNLNQIARQLNSGGDLDMPRIEEAVADFRAACALCAAALGHPFQEKATRATPVRDAARARQVA